MLSFNDWMNQSSKQSQTVPNEVLELPDWTYDTSNLPIKNSKLLATDLLADYYGQLGSNYLPQLNQFAQENAGKMVKFDPNRFMSIEDFGWDHDRAGLRGNYVDRNWTIGDETLGTDTLLNSGKYYTKNGLQLGSDYSDHITNDYWEKQLSDGLYTLDEDTNQLVNVNAVRESHEDAVNRLLSQGGGYKTGNYGDGNRNSYDFMSEMALEGIASEANTKWGKDLVNLPHLKKYLDDPNWVSRGEDGAVESIRAELYPLLMQEALGGEYRNINRGSTKESDFMGDMVKSLVMGVATGGLGLAGASALGFGSAAAGAGLGATAAGMGAGGLATAGAISGGLNSALTGGDVLKGALTGGLTGGLSKFAAPTINSALGGMGVNGSMRNVLTGGLTSLAGGGLSSAITGGQFNPLASFASGATQGYMGSQSGKQLMSDLGVTNPYAQTMLRSFAPGTVGSIVSGRTPNVKNSLLNSGMKTFQQWLNDQGRG